MAKRRRNPLKRGNAALPTGKKAELEAKQIAALGLRLQGRLLWQIANELDFRSAQAVAAAIKAALHKVDLEAVEDMRKIHVLRLESFLNALDPGIRQGKPSAITAAVAVLRRSAALQALDPSLSQPAGVQVYLYRIGNASPKSKKELNDTELGIAIEWMHRHDPKALPVEIVDGEVVMTIPEEEIDEGLAETEVG